MPRGSCTLRNEANISLGREIDRLEKQAILDAELSAPMANPLTGKPAVSKPEGKVGRAEYVGRILHPAAEAFYS